MAVYSLSNLSAVFQDAKQGIQIDTNLLVQELRWDRLTVADKLDRYLAEHQPDVRGMLTVITGTGASILQLREAYNVLDRFLSTLPHGRVLRELIAYAYVLPASSVLRLQSQFITEVIKLNEFTKCMYDTIAKELAEVIVSKEPKVLDKALDILEVYDFLNEYETEIEKDTRYRITNILSNTLGDAIRTRNHAIAPFITYDSAYQVFSGSYKLELIKTVRAVFQANKEEMKASLRRFEGSLVVSTSYSILDEVVYDSGLYHEVNKH